MKLAERDAGQSKHLRVVILAMEGWTAPGAAMAVGLSRRVSATWQHLPPWSAADDAKILDAGDEGHRGSHRAIGAPAKMSPLRLPAAQKITLE